MYALITCGVGTVGTRVFGAYIRDLVIPAVCVSVLSMS